MSVRTSLFVISVLSIGLSGCGADDAPATPTNTPAATSSSMEKAEVEAKPVTRTKTEVGDITYRPVKAKLRLSGESIEVLVPDDVDLESGRMLEYRIGNDGKYYLRSIISN